MTSAGVQAEVLPFDTIVTQLDSAGAVCSAWEPARLAARTATDVLVWLSLVRHRLEASGLVVFPRRVRARDSGLGYR